MAHVRNSCVDFVNDWCWTYDPREIGKGKSPYMPFDLFPKQAEFLLWLEERVDSGDEWLVEKCRDAGASYLTVAFALHRWLFRDAFKVTFGSRVEDAVDKAGNPDTIFEKLRIILRRLPLWMLPAGFDERRHSLYMRLMNPANGSVISGEGGPNMGRGGRSAMYVVDEGAHIERAEKVEAAIIGNADCRGWISSANGMGNLFYRKRQNDDVKVFTFRLEDDPRKTPEWISRKKATTDPVTWAQEYEIDYGASAEGVFIPGPWVNAAVKLGKLLDDRLKPAAVGVAGLDVGGGGSGKTVLVKRMGPVVLLPRSWNTADNITTTHEAIEDARAAGCSIMNYDSIGVGNTVTSTLMHAGKTGLKVYPINVGDTPTDAEWPDGRTSKEMFANLKAELWWMVRCAFQRSYELVLFLEGDPKGVEHPLEDVIVLPEGSKELTGQLPVPKMLRNGKGRIAVESKDSLKRRGIPSPDFAEALVLSFAPEPVTAFVLPSITPIWGGRPSIG